MTRARPCFHPFQCGPLWQCGCFFIEHTAQIGEHHILIFGKAFVAAAGSYALCVGIKGHETDLATKTILGLLNGINNILDAGAVHKVDHLTGYRDWQIGC